MGKKVAFSMVVLIVLLALAVGYIAYDKYSVWKQDQDFGIYQQGAQEGYEQAVMQMFQQASSCQQVPLTVENQTIGIVAVECLQQSG
jgi:uncharacterized membrane protein YebE (DUF533 family)